MGLIWLPRGAHTKYLDFIFEDEIAQQDKDEAIMHQIRTKLAQWLNKKLPFLSQVLVLNQVILKNI